MPSSDLSEFDRNGDSSGGLAGAPSSESVNGSSIVFGGGAGEEKSSNCPEDLLGELPGVSRRRAYGGPESDESFGSSAAGSSGSETFLAGTIGSESEEKGLRPVVERTRAGDFMPISSPSEDTGGAGNRRGRE
jgi:hypothetical protein